MSSSPPRRALRSGAPPPVVVADEQEGQGLDGVAAEDAGPNMDLLAPWGSSSYSPQHSVHLNTPHRQSAATARTLSIASYYYAHQDESGDDAGGGAEQRQHAQRPLHDSSTSGSQSPYRRDGSTQRSAHSSGVNLVGDGHSPLEHNHTLGTGLEQQQQDRGIFASWGDALQERGIGNAMADHNDVVGGPQQGVLQDIFGLSVDEAIPRHLSPELRRRPSTSNNARAQHSHSRVVSSATEGDVALGADHLYGQHSFDAAESMQTLNLGFEEAHGQPGSSASLPNTPMYGFSGGSDHQTDQHGALDESESAGLTSNKQNVGWISRTSNMVQSPDEDIDSDRSPASPSSASRRAQEDYFGADATSGGSRRRNVSGADEDVEDGTRTRASAELHNSFSAAEGQEKMAKARSGLDKFGKSLRRVSRRVVNLDGNERPNREGRIRLPDNDDDDSDGENVIQVQRVPTKSAVDGLRGKSLGIFSPTSRIRRGLARFMTQWWIEPIILSAIIVNTVMLIIQSASNVFVHPRKLGYFDYWTDYALLSIFCLYTAEAIARIIVSGFMINPPPAYSPETDKRSSVQDKSSVSSNPNSSQPKPTSGDPRARMMRSNTRDTFVAFGDSVKSRAATALKPHQDGGRSVSPNRIRAPRTVTSSHIYPQATDPDPQPSDGKANVVGSGILDDKTSRFLQRTKLAPFAHAIVLQRAQAVDYAYLRHSWNRIDFLAIFCFWMAFILGVLHQEEAPNHHIFIFRALSVLRVSRLLTATRGTSVILRSLKTATPILVNVAFFTGFSMLLFSVIGVQSFEGNYRRSCQWVGDLQTGLAYTPGTNYSLGQLCGGFYDSVSGGKRAPLSAEGYPLDLSIKGYICPQGQICLEAENPENGTESFDNVFEALLQVVIVTSLNGWSSTMYNMVDADYFPSVLYFIIGVIIMNFWMANLFVAVITNTFATISAETKQSAFAAEKIEAAKPVLTETEPSRLARHRQRAATVFKRVWGYTKYLWLALIVADLAVQASQASYHRTTDNEELKTAELYITIALDAEILMRFFAYLLDNDWRNFFSFRRNRFDLFLAIVTTIMQIPAIKNSGVYAWMTVFQLARFYRVIAAVPRMDALLTRVFGSMTGLFNMILFLLMVVGLAALASAQLFRGDIPQNYEGEPQEINFKTIYNSFLGMYQLFSSENWTTPLYSVLTAEGAYKQAVIGGIFLCAWFFFANFIVLQMFIAVIAENFGVAENQKRSQQLELYLRNLEKPGDSWGNRLLNQLSPYRWLRERNAVLAGEKQPSHQGWDLAEDAMKRLDEKARFTPSRARKLLKYIRGALRLDRPQETVPLNTVRARNLRNSLSGASVLSPRRGHSVYDTNNANTVNFLTPHSNEETARVFARDRQLTRMRTGLGLVPEEGPNQDEINEEHRTRLQDDPRIVQARLINAHPSYEKSLWLFSNTNSFRRSCQSFVPCSHGERLFGRRTSSIRLKIYQIILFATVGASVIIAGIATPKYRRDWYANNGLRRDSWFSLTEVALSAIFVIEFFVKVIADGFAFTPNAYLLSPWNALDLFVLMTLIVNVTTELAVIGGVSRFTRALKAFRALRLINLSNLMRRTFAGLIKSAGRFVDASILAILYIVPFAIWGQNLFSGLLYSCTDTSPGIMNKGDCINEYSSSPSEWSFLAPRAWQNPNEGSMYSFDDFRSSLLILFEIVSLEGWINVMTTAMSVTGYNQQLQTDARQINAMFFVIYNLIGAIFVLTLFVAVIIEGFESFSGAAYQTAQQRQWIDLKRLIARQRPSKRPKQRPTDPFRSWCFERATRKDGWWSRFMTLLFLAALITLATQTYHDDPSSERARDVVYVIVACFYAGDILIRLLGLGWRSYRQNVWNVFDLIVVTGTFATSIPLLSPRQSALANLQVQKIFLVAMAFKLVQKNNALNQLFKTAISSLPSIASLFLLWLTMFLVWGIMLVEVFGLTAWGLNETYSKNFSTLLGSLVFLSMTSTGEGWNSYMHDYTLSPPLCTPAANYLNTDCGSVGYAYFLFIGWNVISMYIFLNMFTGTVVEKFSYVYQLGGKPTLTRQQVRNFKQAWAEHDTGRTGYMAREKFVPFFNSLEGVLELRVHPRSAQIRNLKAKAMVGDKRRSVESSSFAPPSPLREAAQHLRHLGVDKINNISRTNEGTVSSLTGPIVAGLSIPVLRQSLQELDHEEIQRRRYRFERIFHEAIILSERPQDRAKGGISFSDMLLLVAHYKLIDDEQALSVEELIDRRELLTQVEDRIETERVRGLLRLMWLRRRFLAMRGEHHRLGKEQMAHSHAETIPEINIEDDADLGKETNSASRPALRLDTGVTKTREGDHVPPSRGDEVFASSSRKRIFGEVDDADDQPSIRITATDDDDDSDDENRKSRQRHGDEFSEQESLRPSTSPSGADVNHLGYMPYSSSPSLQELERRASPIIQEIDHSAWGALARRLPGDGLLADNLSAHQATSQSQLSLISGLSATTSESFWGAAAAAARRLSGTPQRTSGAGSSEGGNPGASPSSSRALGERQMLRTTSSFTGASLDSRDHPISPGANEMRQVDSHDGSSHASAASVHRSRRAR